MKRFLSLLLAFLCTLVFSSCEKPNNEGPIETPEDNSFYYVKYETVSYSGTNSITVNTDTGKKSYSLGPHKAYSETFGPVSKGFEASIKSQASITTRICISKNNGPFALKAEGRGTASYTIDF